jgi:hypothetical protein
MAGVLKATALAVDAADLDLSDFELDWEDNNHEEDTFFGIMLDKSLFTPQDCACPRPQELSVALTNWQAGHLDPLLAALSSKQLKHRSSEWPLEPIFVPPTGVVSHTSICPTLLSPLPLAQLLCVLGSNKSSLLDGDDDVVGLKGTVLQGRE